MKNMLFALVAAVLSIQAQALQNCRPLPLSHAEDFALAANLDVVFTAESLTDVAGIKALQIVNGNVVQVPLKVLNWPKRRNLKANGLDFFTDASGDRLFIVNLTKENLSIEQFIVEKTEAGEIYLTWLSSIASPLITSPNDVRAISADQIYVSNDQTNPFGGGGNLVLCVKSQCRTVADGISFANGLASITQNGVNYLFNAETLNKSIQIYRIGKSGSLAKVREIALSFSPDNIQFDSTGKLWIAGFPDVGQTTFNKKVSESFDASSAISTLSFDGRGWREKVVYYDDTTKNPRINASTGAIEMNGVLLMTSNSDSRSYACPIVVESKR